jgi:SAM-dependent methyltransferase
MKLNLGCGSQTPEGWINVDYAVGAKLAKVPLVHIINKKLRLFNLDWNKGVFIHDLRKPFPWRDETIDIVYSSHTLEHFTRNEGLRFLNECHRVLKGNGIIRIVIPDLLYIVSEYRSGNIRADSFVEKLGVLSCNGPNPIKNRLAPLIHFPHKCMYDTPTLISILREIGFNAVSRRSFDSDIPDIEDVELKSRTENAVIAEGRKS